MSRKAQTPGEIKCKRREYQQKYRLKYYQQHREKLLEYSRQHRLMHPRKKKKKPTGSGRKTIARKQSNAISSYDLQRLPIGRFAEAVDGIVAGKVTLIMITAILTLEDLK
jgi:hypothetical protein